RKPCVLRDSARISVTPGLPDRHKGCPGHTHRIDDDVVHGHVKKVQPAEKSVDLPTDEQVGSRRLAERPRPLPPERIGVERARLEVDHPVVLGDHVDPASGTRDADELGEHALRIGDRMDYMAADRQVEGAAREAEVVDAAVLEAYAFAEVGETRPGEL